LRTCENLTPLRWVTIHSVNQVTSKEPGPLEALSFMSFIYRDVIYPSRMILVWSL
jgi:hypothetical protein